MSFSLALSILSIVLNLAVLGLLVRRRARAASRLVSATPSIDWSNTVQREISRKVVTLFPGEPVICLGRKGSAPL